MTQIEPVYMPFNRWTIDDLNSTVIGYGTYKQILFPNPPNGDITSDHLREGSLKVLNQEICINDIGEFLPQPTDQFLCAAGNQNICNVSKLIKIQFRAGNTDLFSLETFVLGRQWRSIIDRREHTSWYCQLSIRLW